MPNQPIKKVGATCAQCGEAKYVMNPNTGKVFCADKCWTKPKEEDREIQVEDLPTGAPGYAPVTPAPEEVKEPDWDAIAEGKVRTQIAKAYITADSSFDDADEKERWVAWCMTGEDIGSEHARAMKRGLES